MSTQKQLIFMFALLFGTGGVFVWLFRVEGGRFEKELHSKTLAETRKEHKTDLKKKGPAPGQYSNVAPPFAEVVQYDSNGNKLLAWIIKPNIPGKRPAVLFAHGGDSLGAGDVDTVMPFVKNGYLVMLPSWRGENGNPGYYEMCYGEVDDAVAAVDYLAARPDVDGNFLFAAGHSVGGTIVMLLAESTNKLKKATACGGLPSMKRGTYPDPPFSKHNVTECALRSPIEYVRDLSCPMRLFYGTDENDKRMHKLAEKMKAEGIKFKSPEIEVEWCSARDHFSALEDAIPRTIKYFSVY